MPVSMKQMFKINVKRLSSYLESYVLVRAAPPMIKNNMYAASRLCVVRARTRRDLLRKKKKMLYWYNLELTS